MDTFAAIADERRELGEDLAVLSPAQQQTASLCQGWTVHDVLAHLVMPLEVSMPRFALAMLRARGNFHRANRALTAAQARRSFTELVGVLRDKADLRFTPPGQGPEAPLVDVLVHGLDIRRPLGIARTVPQDRSRTALVALTTAPAVVVRPGLMDALRLEATDIAWSHGAGPIVRGTADDLLLSLTGRRLALAQLSGDGVATLTARLG